MWPPQVAGWNPPPPQHPHCNRNNQQGLGCGWGGRREEIFKYCGFIYFVLTSTNLCCVPLSGCGAALPLDFSSLLGRRRPLEVPDLFDQIVLLVAELLVLRAVRLEVAQELHQFGLVLQQYVHHRLGLAGVCHKHLFFFPRKET